MKTTLFTMLFFCSAAAFGQASASISSEPQMIQVPSHQLHASQHFMQNEQTLLIVSSNVEGRGERPLWEAGAKPAAEIPLGDVARLLRTQHSAAKKAVKVLEK